MTGLIKRTQRDLLTRHIQMTRKSEENVMLMQQAEGKVMVMISHVERKCHVNDQ